MLFCFKRLERLKQEWQPVLEELTGNRTNKKPITKPLRDCEVKFDSVINGTGKQGYDSLRQFQLNFALDNWSLHAASVAVLNQLINTPHAFHNWRAVYSPKEETLTLKPADSDIAESRIVPFKRPCVTA